MASTFDEERHCREYYRELLTMFDLRGAMKKVAQAYGPTAERPPCNAPQFKRMVWITVEPRPDIPDFRSGECGDYLWLENNGTGKVIIYREHCDDDRPLEQAEEIALTADNPLGEMSTFAHELGHHFSKLSLGENWVHFDLNNLRPLESFEEEVRAWHNAEALLTDFKPEWWPEFHRNRATALHGYFAEFRKRTGHPTAIEAHGILGPYQIPIEGITTA